MENVIEASEIKNSMYGNGGDDVIERDNDQIAMCAYYKAEARGFAPGYELDDWLAAEIEIDDAQLASKDMVL